MATGNCPETTLRKQQLQKPKAKKGWRELGVSRLYCSPYGLFVQQRHAKEGRKRKKRRKKKKKKSNKEVDISRAHPRALNTFLLHFNGFLKPILMQIKACLSKHSQKPGLGLVGKPGSPSHPRSGVTVAWLPSPQGHLMCRSTLWMCWMLNSCDLVLYFMHNCVFSPLKKASLHNFGRRGKNQAPKPTWSFTM